MSWQASLSLWAILEGAYNVITNPPEGETAGGILRKYYLTWAQTKGRAPVWPPTEESHSSYLYDEIWTPHKCSEFPDPADAVAFQLCGNLPWTRANQVLQLSLGQYPDGNLGPKTLAAIRNWDKQELIERFLLSQQTHYLDSGDVDGLVIGRIAKVREWLATAQS